MNLTPSRWTAEISPARVREQRRVERELPVAALPRVVEQNPADRDLRRLEPVDVLEHLTGPVDDVAPLDQLELRRGRHDRHPGLALVVGERLLERARRRGARRASRPAGTPRPGRSGPGSCTATPRRPRSRTARRAGEGEPRAPLAGQPDPPAGGAGEERDRDARALRIRPGSAGSARAGRRTRPSRRRRESARPCAVSNASYTAWMPVAGWSATSTVTAVAVVATVTVAVRPGSVVATW